jgi:hypothetical protein
VGARQYTQREWRLLSWWLATYHPNADILMNVRIGPTVPAYADNGADNLPEGSLRVRNRWADAIYVEGGTPTIVEAKIDPDPGIFSQLIHYARKFRQDSQFAQFERAPLRLVALVYNDDPSVGQEAPFYGVKWEVYHPSLNNVLPPVLKGSPLASSVVPLPSDWPARLRSWGIEYLGPSGS